MACEGGFAEVGNSEEAGSLESCVLCEICIFKRGISLEYGCLESSILLEANSLEPSFLTEDRAAQVHGFFYEDIGEIDFTPEFAVSDLNSGGYDNSDLVLASRALTMNDR